MQSSSPVTVWGRQALREGTGVKVMRRREFLKGSAILLGLNACRIRGWETLRLVHRAHASEVELAALEDARSLLSRATGRPVPLLGDEPRDGLVIFVNVTEGDPGAFRVSSLEGRIVVEGADGEGARNGLYALLEHFGFGFFRDGVTVPTLLGAHEVSVELEDTPAFRWRGDMIWDNYLGPRRFCASMWGDEEWEQALLYMARHRMNFLEFYPPLDGIFARAFPEVERELRDGSVWKSATKHELAKRVLARGRALGIHFMYVLGYGAFPEPVRALFPDLEWRNGFLCAHQPELMELTERVWRAVIDQLGTDHWYAVRHRGEEEQVYSDPCRSVTKKEGFQQAFAVLRRVDPEARITVWTWGERIPDLFEDFPDNVRAVHVRHGMSNVFGDRGEGREQTDGRPELPSGTGWLSAQFTVFGGNETGPRTSWCDANTLAEDAAASRDGGAEGYLQWPEWTNTSAWLAHVVARLGWRPQAPEFKRYARLRHGTRATAFLEAFGPLLRDGNARFMYPPRKRLLVPYFNAPESLALLRSVRDGATAMLEILNDAPPMFRRDFADIVIWIGLRQAQVLECESYLRHVEGEDTTFDGAEHTWRTLAAFMGGFDDLSIVASARAVERVGPLSARLEDSIWTLGCDFYNGYPLVLSPEAIELVYLPQLERLHQATVRERPAVLEAPGWFWHDFPNRDWADCVRKLPGEDASALEQGMRARLRAPTSPMREAPQVADLLSQPLPAPRSEPPELPVR